jgi:FAD/FMN-containing dehydrogenase
VITLEAGVTLHHAQQAAERKGLVFPLWIASQGTAQVGGNLSTNAGGINVIAYGNTRDLCLGLEVVLATGEVWNGLKSLRKDNTGYDLKHLFIGAEGTLGIITAASMKLLPRPSDRATVFASVGSPEDALALLSLVRRMSGAAVVAFEIMPRSGLDMVIAHAGCRDPLQAPSDWYVLFELAGFHEAPEMEQAATGILAVAFEEGLVADATIAASGQQAAELWRLREMMSEVQRLEGGSIKHDVSVPVSKVPEFLEAATSHGQAHDTRLPAGAVRPHRRRQHPFQHFAARRRRQGGVPGPLGRRGPRGARHRAGHGRFDQRRTWHRHLEAR